VGCNFWYNEKELAAEHLGQASPSHRNNQWRIQDLQTGGRVHKKIKVKNLSCLGFSCVSLPLLMYECCFYQRPFRGPTAYFKKFPLCDIAYYEETEKNLF